MTTMQLVKQNVLQINWNMFGFCIDDFMYLIFELESEKESAEMKITTKGILVQ